MRMALCKNKLCAVIFDYGSTLIEFGAPQIDACDQALAEALERLFGSVDFEGLRRVRNQDRVAPYLNGYHENDMSEISANLVRELYGREPSAAELQAVLDVRHTSFVDAIEAPEYLAGFLREISQRYKLGLLSNYPDTQALRASVARLGLAEYFDAVVVSGDVGRVKPHVLPFQRMLERLGVEPDEALYVGDNWLGDIQGAKRVGMQAVWTLQYESPEKFERQPGDVDPDLTIRHITELCEHL